jgi:hypothetical protein
VVGRSNQKKGGWMVKPEGKRLDSQTRRRLDSLTRRREAGRSNENVRGWMVKPEGGWTVEPEGLRWEDLGPNKGENNEVE